MELIMMRYCMVLVFIAALKRQEIDINNVASLISKNKVG